MCLDSGHVRITQSSLVETGWKTFIGGITDLRFQNFGIGGKTNVPLDKWIRAEESQVRIGSGSYTSGFHIYNDETDAAALGTPRLVYFRNAHTLGTQASRKVVVAKEMYVPSNPDAWPPR